MKELNVDNADGVVTKLQQVKVEVGEPFRKYDKPDPHAMGIIYVADEFNYQLDKDNYKEFIKFKDK